MQADLIPSKFDFFKAEIKVLPKSVTHTLSVVLGLFSILAFSTCFTHIQQVSEAEKANDIVIEAIINPDTAFQKLIALDPNLLVVVNKGKKEYFLKKSTAASFSLFSNEVFASEYRIEVTPENTVLTIKKLPLQLYPQFHKIYRLSQVVESETNLDPDAPLTDVRLVFKNS